MSLEVLRRLLVAHAALAWLSAAALAAAAWAHARGRLPPRLGALAAALALGCAGLGLAMEDGYRARIRQKLFARAPDLGWLFERKLHLAVGAVLLAVAGAAALWAQRRAEGDASARELGRAAGIAWAVAAALAWAATIAGAVVARKMGF